MEWLRCSERDRGAAYIRVSSITAIEEGYADPGEIIPALIRLSGGGTIITVESFQSIVEQLGIKYDHPL